ncbi:MAG TPA: hypothetical protein VI894_03155 [Candidatus Nanoarchaeia archaeon]|nr:hypothetical protein [Candidatus Nanoarchaeia archaeon]
MKRRRKSSKEILFDDIDINIIEELKRNPRENLRRISQILKKKKILASPETIRKRINNLSKTISFQPMINTTLYGLEVAVLFIKVKGSTDARRKIIEKLAQFGGYNIVESIGYCDIMFYITVHNSSELSEIVDSLKSLQDVDDVHHIIITKHHSSIAQLINKLRRNN